MRYMIATLLLLYIYDAKAIEVKLTQGLAFHYQPSLAYNDSIINDNRTSTNTLLTISQGKYSFTILADSQGDTSMALIRSISLSERFSLVGGLYLLRDKALRKYEPQAPILLFPNFNVGPRSFLITPLVGLQHTIKLSDKWSLDTLITPAFVLCGITIKL